MNVKNQQLLWDLYAGIARVAKKNPSGYYGNYMRVLQKMLKKPSEYHGTQMNEECQQLFVAHMRVLQGMQNASLYAGIAMNAKCLWLF
jgi:RNA binding exosome subunit